MLSIETNTLKLL